MTNSINHVKNEKSATSIAFTVVCITILVLYTLTLAVSFGWGIMNSFKDPLDYSIDPFGFPPTIIFTNYAESFQNIKVTVKAGLGSRDVYITEMLLNTLLYAGGCAFFQTLSCCVMAYAVARYDNFVSKAIYFIVILVMILPIVGQLPSEVQMLMNLRLYDTMAGAWMLSFNFLGMHFLIFYESFRALPKEYSEAAMIDGAGNWRIFLRVMLPLVKYAIFTIFLLKFITYWNDYQTPLVYIPDEPVLAYGLWKFFTNPGNGPIRFSSMPHKIAGCMIVFLPIFAGFLALHKRLIGNVSMGGIKG